MKINENRILILAIIFPLYITLIFYLSRPFFAKLYTKNITEKNLIKAISYERANSAYQYLIARFYFYNNEHRNLSKAINHYKESLRLSPLQGGCWLDLAKAYQIADRTREAGYAIERALTLIPKNPAVNWEAGVFYLINGEKEKAIKSFKNFLLINPAQQKDVYELVWQIPIDSQYLLKELLPPSYQYYKEYLLYLIATDRVNETKELWKTLRTFKIEDEVILKYTDYLISRNYYSDASNLWKDYISGKFSKEEINSVPNLWNGSFEYEVLNGGFDWKVNETEGVDVFIDEDIHLFGNRSLGIIFDGNHNPDITIASQVVQVDPGGTYSLRGYIKTEALTTTNGIFFVVEGHDCKGFLKKSEVLTGTTFWKEVNLDFSVPDGCNAITVKVRRERSHKLDNKIVGNAWIDAITLTKK